MEVEVTRSKVESVEIVMLLLFGSKFLRFLDSFTLLSRVTSKVSVKLSHQSITCYKGVFFQEGMITYATHRVMAMGSILNFIENPLAVIGLVISQI